MYLDLLLGAIIVISVVWGLVNGAIRELFALGGVVAGIYIAARFYTKLALTLHIENAKVFGSIVIFVLVFLAIYLIGILVYQLLRFLKLGILDRLLGLVLGVIRGGALAGIACLFVGLFPEGQEIMVKESSIAPYVLKELHWVKMLLPDELQEKFKWNTPREQK